MGRLSHHEMKLFGEAVLHVHRTRDALDFSGNLLRTMRVLFSVDVCVVDWYGFQGLPVRTLYDPATAVPREVNAALHAFSHQNPVYRLCRGAVGTLSDFLSRAQWHRTGLYAEGYGKVGQEDSMVLDIRLRKDCRLTLITSRGRRGFTLGERVSFALLEPHVREVFQRVSAQERLRKALPAPGSEIAVGPSLSVREREVLQWLAGGKSNGEISFLLGVRPTTVKRYLESLYQKLGISNRTAAALRFLVR